VLFVAAALSYAAHVPLQSCRQHKCVDAVGIVVECPASPACFLHSRMHALGLLVHALRDKLGMHGRSQAFVHTCHTVTLSDGALPWLELAQLLRNHTWFAIEGTATHEQPEP
jgi:hypothetical protein